MRYPPFILIIPLIVLSAHAMEPLYQGALDSAMKEYPPGDYQCFPVRYFTDNSIYLEKGAARNAAPKGSDDLLVPSGKDSTTLLFEGAAVFTQGRFDLATKRFQQTRLLDPTNENAKTKLNDIDTIRSAYGIFPLREHLHFPLPPRFETYDEVADH
jgi:hypothetical protein